MTYVLGLTGSIATGKSTVAQVFRDQGFPVVDADALAHAAVAPKTQGLANIIQAFGPTILTADGQLDRRKLGHIVFADPAKRALLNRINGPLIRKSILAEVDYWRQQKVPLVVLDIPLLFETHYEPYVDGVMVAYVPEELQLKRLMARDGYDEVEARARMASQMSIETKKQRADFYTDNTKSVASLQGQVLDFLKANHFLKNS
ncbi:MAG: dephospho-CoA kinase [Lactobacillus sp.]|jgi:dephospho-CoA kinase|nr:dephospho-CoA kinase [Lactobacillus sp.]